jgi:hypothetical protein
VSRPALTVALVAATGLACGAPVAEKAECQRDDQCGAGHACAGGRCLPRAAPPATWSIELAPRSDSPAALTELTGVQAPAGAFDLQAADKVTLAGTLTLDAGAAPLTVAHIVLAVPSTIPGRPDLQFETDLPAAKDAAAPTFRLSVPAPILGRSGRFQVLPLPPSDRDYAPLRATLPVATGLVLPLAGTRLTVRGRLLSAVGAPRGGFTARVFLGGELVSNVDVTTAAGTADDGAFTLLVPKSAADAAAPAFTLDLDPTADAGDPRFASKPFALAANVDLGDVALPPFGQANVFRFVVSGADDQKPAVSGAVVRAWTLLADDAKGKTDFVRAAPTDGMGRASLGLLPGTTNGLVDYDVAVVPPPDSEYGVRCIAKFPLASGGTGEQPAILPPVLLPRRAKVSGIVRDHGGTPAAGVMVLATRTAADPASHCAANVGAAPATTTTGKDGAYTLSLDPGTYRLDYDPPSGAPFPRFVETTLVVPLAGVADTIAHDASLPAGAIVEGTASGPDGAPLPLSGVRIYDEGATLRAQTRTDASGHFRAVLPVE